MEQSTWEATSHIQPVKKFLSFYGTQTFITVSTSDHPTGHCPEPDESNPQHTHFNLIYAKYIYMLFLYRCETWCLTLREEEHRLRVFENMLQKSIFGSKRDQVAGVWRRLHNQELHNLHTLPNIVRLIKLRRVRWMGYVACMGIWEVYIKFQLENLRPKHRWEDNIRLELKK